MNQENSHRELLDKIAKLEKENAQLKSPLKALEKDPTLFQDFITHFNDVVWIGSLDSDENYVLRPTLENIFGYGIDKFTENPNFWLEIVLPEDKEIAQKHVENLLKEGRSETEYRIKRPDGDIRWVLDRTVAIETDESQPRQFFGITTDITQRKALEIRLKQSEKRFQDLALSSADWFWEVDENAEYTYVSESIEQILGFHPDEIIGKTPFDLMPEDEAKHIAAIFEKIVRDKAPIKDLENWNLSKDGKRICLLTNGVPITDENGNFRGYRGIDKDITDQKLISIRLRESEEKYRILAEANPDVIFMMDRDDKILYVNASTADIFNTPARDFIGKRVVDFLSFDDAERLNEQIRSALKTGEKAEFENLLITNDEKHYYNAKLSPIKDSLGKPVSILCIAQEITDRKNVEIALKASEERYRALTERSPDIIMQFDKECRHLYVSPSVTRFTDMDPAQFLGRTHKELGFPEDMCRYFEETVAAVFESSQPFETEFDTEGMDGQLILNLRLFPEFDKNHDVASVLTIARDITHHRNTERDYRTLFNEMLDGFALHEIILDESGSPVDYRFLAINPAFEKLTGLQSDLLLGKRVKEIMPDIEPFWIETYGRVAETGEPEYFENYSRDLDKHFNVCAFRPAPGQFATIFEDITRSKKAEADKGRLESQLQQALKMESIGTLAGGIAHDFNNILGIILGNAELALDDLPDWNPAAGNLEEIIKASLRAKNVIRQLLSFSRQADYEKKPVNIVKVVTESISFLRSSIPSSIDIQPSIQKESGFVSGDPTQIHQIMLNLCSNAADAMPGDEGTIKISLEAEELKETLHMDHWDIPPGKYMVLTIDDDGEGIPPLIKTKIFDPYFTTKGVGKGTGMGLAVVHGIVKNYKGEITVTSDQGRGSIFKLYLPAIEQTLENNGESSYSSIPRGSEKILFVDDERAILRMGTKLMERLGYEVTALMDSVEALNLFKAGPGRFDLIITDMTMPKMTGEKLAGEIMNIRPDIPIILCTGYSHLISELQAKEAGITEFAEKPLKMKELASIIRKALDRH